MKIKFQSGGMITYTPVFPQPLSGSGESNSSKSGKQEKITGTLQEEIIKVLKENGIQSDVDAFLVQANEFLTKSKGLSTVSMFGGQDDYTLTDLVAVMRMANAVKQNKEQWTTASNRLTEQNAWDEVATTTNGAIYVYDEKKGLQTISPDEYHENQEKYHGRALTNSQVLGLREQNSALAFNTNILKDLAGTLSITTIKNDLVDTITKFGNVSRSEYIKKTGDSISQSTWEGFQYLIVNGPDGYYKATTKSERENVQSAVKYLWDSLGSDGKKRLRAEAAVSGEDPNKNHLDLILHALEAHTDYQVDPSFDKSASEYDPDGDGKGDGKSGGEVRDTLAEKYTSGSGAPPAKYEILMTSNSGAPLFAFTQDLGPIFKSDGKTPKGDANLKDVLTDGYGLTTVDRRSITFGDIPIAWEDANKIVYDASTNIKRIYLPAKNVNGKIMPDFDLYQTIANLNDRCEDYTPGQIKSLLESSYPNLKYNEETGLIEAKNTQLFLTFGAIASDDTYGDVLEDSKWLVAQSDNTDYALQNSYNSLIGADAQGAHNVDGFWNFFAPWNWGFKFYKGNVFIPITDPMLASTIYNDQYWPKDNYRYITQKAEAQARQQQREASSDIITGF